MTPLMMAGLAHAGGYYYADSGIVAAGRGGAWVAGADTQFAQEYNPAGLIRVRQPTLNLGLSLVQQRPTFDPAGPEQPVTNLAPPFSVPQVGFVTPIRSNLAFAFGFYSPFAPSSEYSPRAITRYSVIESSVYQFSVGPSLAWQPVKALTLGAGINGQYFLATRTLDVTVNGQTDPGGDIGVALRAQDPFTFSWNAGLLVEVVPALAFGLSTKPGTRHVATGTGELDFRGNNLEVLLNETRYRDEVVASLALPWMIRAGVAVRPTPAAEIEAAVVWQQWSSLGDIVVEEIDITVDSDLLPPEQSRVAEELKIPAGLDDTWSLRLGGEWRCNKWLELRAGGAWESASVPTDELTVALVDPSKTQLGGGASVWLLEGEHGRRLRLDAALVGLFFPTLTLEDSTITQIDAGVVPGVSPAVIGNGELSSKGWISSFQVQWLFGGERS